MEGVNFKFMHGSSYELKEMDEKKWLQAHNSLLATQMEKRMNETSL